MNLKKIVTLLSTAFAASALAAPASASTEPVFTHKSEPIAHNDPKTVVFSGSVAVSGVHCSHVTTTFILEATGTGKVTSFSAQNGEGTTCTSTPGHFMTHATATDTSWKVTTDGHATITIHDIDIDYKMTHPITQHLVLVSWELTGDVGAEVPVGQTEDIQTMTLTGIGTEIHTPTSEPASLSAHLVRTTDTPVGKGTAKMP